jgi:hypothetical protein
MVIRADGGGPPNQRNLFRAQERLDFVQPEEARGIATTAHLPEDTAVVARQREKTGRGRDRHATSTTFMR